MASMLFFFRRWKVFARKSEFLGFVGQFSLAPNQLVFQIQHFTHSSVHTHGLICMHKTVLPLSRHERNWIIVRFIWRRSVLILSLFIAHFLSPYLFLFTLFLLSLFFPLSPSRTLLFIAPFPSFTHYISFSLTLNLSLPLSLSCSIVISFLNAGAMKYEKYEWIKCTYMLYPAY